VASRLPGPDLSQPDPARGLSKVFGRLVTGRGGVPAHRLAEPFDLCGLRRLQPGPVLHADRAGR